MKRMLKLLFLMPMMIFNSGCNNSAPSTPVDPPAPPADPVPVDVVIISGQSNGVGCTKSEEIKSSIDSGAYHDYMSGFSTVKISYDCWTKDLDKNLKTIFYSQNNSNNFKFVKVMLGQGNSLATFGPEIGIAEELGEKYANKLFIIKLACGASNLKDDWLQKNSPMYPRLINFVKDRMNDLKNNGYLPTIKAFCWMQGEGDSYEGYYDSYLDNTRTFVNNIRADLKELSGNKDVPFIDAGISDAYVWEYYKEVNDAKAQFASESENNIYIDTIAAGLRTDEEPHNEVDVCHYDSKSEILLGKLFARSFEQFLDKSK